MKHRKNVKDEMPVFDNIRKPTAPPSRRFGAEKPDELARPSLRKAKHKPAKSTILGETDDR
ncbi:MAG: hypothetical protein JNL64_04340 [Blastocatellia bacterium]|nr:hypothetical protein [Blastocatellia bacterium]